MTTSIEDVLSSDPNVARRELNDLARHAEAAERYEDMCKFMRLLVIKIEKSDISPKTLTNDERNLLSVAYKNVIGARRASWRTLNADEGQENSLVAEYKRQVEVELEAICREVLDVLKLILKTCEMDTEAHVFYLKMTGDYYRYLAEFKDRSAGCHDKAKSYYQEALDLARGVNGTPGLPTTHPIRLGLALNFSVCYYEILAEREEACDLARRAFDEAISQLDDLDEASYKDSTLIMQLLRDNLTLWTADQLNPQEI